MSFKTAKNANIKIWIKVILGIIKSLKEGHRNLPKQ